MFMMAMPTGAIEATVEAATDQVDVVEVSSIKVFFGVKVKFCQPINFMLKLVHFVWCTDLRKTWSSL